MYMGLFGDENAKTEHLTVRVTDKLYIGPDRDRMPFVFYMDVLEPNPHNAIRHTMIVRAGEKQLMEWFELQIGTTWMIDVVESRGKKCLESIYRKAEDK